MFKEGNVTVLVSDMDRAVRFYTEALGLSVALRHGDDWAQVEAPGLSIGLHPVGEGMAKPSVVGSLSIGFTVEQLETAMGTLKQRGVEFAPQIRDDGPVRLAFFADPDGTPLYLCEVKQSESYR